MFKLIKNNGLQYYVSDLFPENLHHAFTTRNGGSAPEPLNTFSMGTAQFTQHLDYIICNRKAICAELNIDFDHLLMTDQHHTANIAIINGNNNHSKDKFIPHTDAVIIKDKNVATMLFFADCIPVMIYDTKREILGLVHAGWRGTEQKIVIKTIEKFITMFNSSSKDIVAAIGPGIGQCCYEVNEEVADKLLNTITDHPISDKIIQYKNNKPHVDLKEINALQLKSCRVEKIDIIDECTSCNTDLFFSHRATKGQTGRHSLIAQIC